MPDISNGLHSEASAFPLVSRTEAISRGLPHYFTNRPCKRGHVGPRRVSTRICVECARDLGRQYQQADPEKFRTFGRNNYWRNRERAIAYAAGYREENRERVGVATARWRSENEALLRAYAREYYAANKDRLNNGSREWRHAHPEKVREYCANRRARKRGVPGFFTCEDIDRIRRMQRNRCAEPGCRVAFAKVKATIDHIVPLSDPRSSNWPSNLQLLCPSCNGRKNKRDPIDHARISGRLL